MKTTTRPTNGTTEPTRTVTDPLLVERLLQDVRTCARHAYMAYRQHANLDRARAAIGAQNDDLNLALNDARHEHLYWKLRRHQAMAICYSVGIAEERVSHAASDGRNAAIRPTQ
jgi:hypothetical protein